MMKIKFLFKNFLSSSYPVVKKVVLLIFNFFSDVVGYIPTFLFILFILIIAFIAIFAKYLDEPEDMLDTQILDEVKHTEVFSKTKTHHLLEYIGENTPSFTEDFIKPDIDTSQEAITRDALSDNLVAFHLNSFAQLYPGSKVVTVHTGMALKLAESINARAEQLTNNLMSEAEKESYVNKFNFDLDLDSPSDIEHVKNMFETSSINSQDMHDIVAQIQNGSQITVFTPTTESSRVTEEKDPYPSPVTPQNVNPVQVPSRSIVIITKRVEEGEPIPALPSWVHHAYTKRDILIGQRRKAAMFNSDYVNSHVDHTKPSDRNQAWLNSGSEDFNLDVGLGIKSDIKENND